MPPAHSAAVVGPKQLLAGCGLLFVTLLMALAYLLGGSSEETKWDVQIAFARQRIETLRQRLGQCHVARDMETSKAKMEEEEVRRGLSEEIDKKKNDYDAISDHVRFLDKQQDECQVDLAALDAQKETSPDNDMKIRSQRMKDEVAVARSVLEHSIENRTEDDQQLIRLLLAYARSNSAMSTAVRMQKMNEARLRQKQGAQRQRQKSELADLLRTPAPPTPDPIPKLTAPAVTEASDAATPTSTPKATESAAPTPTDAADKPTQAAASPASDDAPTPPPATAASTDPPAPPADA